MPDTLKTLSASFEFLPSSSKVLVITALIAGGTKEKLFMDQSTNWTSTLFSIFVDVSFP